MHQRTRRISGTVLVAATVGGIIWVSAGDLNPPVGPVTPTMKTLGEVEPRIAVNSTNIRGDASSIFNISKPGSYYLTGNITGVRGKSGIKITAGQVTLDLNGFTLMGVPGSLDGINVFLSVNDLAMWNGAVSNWGGDGVNAFNASNSQFDRLRLFNNGGDGIRIGDGGTGTNCTARQNSGSGIVTRLGCLVRGCTALSNGANGIHSQGNCTIVNCMTENNTELGVFLGVSGTIIGCTAIGNTGGGIFASAGGMLIDSTARSNQNDGIVAIAGSTVRGCTATNNTTDGIQVSDNCLLEGNHCHNNGLATGTGAGIHATGTNNRIVGNHLTGADTGLDIDGSGNYVAGNTVKGNTDNYDFVAGNSLNILLCEIPESIDWPANVALAGSLTGVLDMNGMTINADNVTVDLAGHALIGAPGSTTGIGIVVGNRVSNVEIRNGTVRDFGGHGIRDNSPIGGSHRVIGVRSIGNGSAGIELFSERHLVKGCTVEGNGADGISVLSGSTVTGNTVSNNQRYGIATGSACLVIGNTAVSNGLSGLVVNGSSLLDRNTAVDNDQSGRGFANITICPNCTFGVNHAP